jgi:hypothetical protein
LLLSAVFAVLSLACKQTLAPVLLAFCLFVLIADGLRVFYRYLASLLVSGTVVVSFLVFRFWPLKDFLFNVVTMATHRPIKSQLMQGILRTSTDTAMESLPAIFCLLAFFLYWYFYERSFTKSWRDLFSNQRWLIFPLAGILLAPVCIKARMTVGGSRNQIALFCYFLALGATLGLKGFMNEEASSTRATASKFLATALIAMSFSGLVEALYDKLSLPPFSSKSNVTMAYEYALKHPGKGYFPYYPLAGYYAQHHFYDVDGALQDREVTGYQVSQAQLAAGIPSEFTVVAYSKDQVPSKAMQEYIAGWPQVRDPELPGWTVFERPPVVPRTPQ